MICNPMLYAGAVSAPSETRHTLTVTYQITGETAPTTYVSTYAEGSSYSVISPLIVGYTASLERVTGIMGEEDVSVTVTYSINSYELKIYYVDANGNTLHTTSISTHQYKASYSVTSPTISGYTVTTGQEVISGTMPARSLLFTVVYNSSSTEDL